MLRFRRFWLTGSLMATLAVVGAGQTQRDTVKENAILDRLREIAPKAVVDFEAGTAAMDSDDYVYAVESYQKVLKAAPDFEPALRRLGVSMAYSRHLVEGKALLERAIARNRSPENLSSLAQVLAYSPDESATEEAKLQALQVAREAYSRANDKDPSYPTLLAQLALDCESEPDFRTAAQT